MIKILTVIGARPQIIKSSAISRTIKKQFSNKLTEYILHTGQHYDDNMSQVFFNELEIPLPNANLNIGSMAYDLQILKMKNGIIEVITNEKPNCVLVYGDTNSTHAASVAAAEMDIPILHIEAGMRSFNDEMPEEKNRIICDKLSTLLFSPTRTGIENLANEGIQNNKTGTINSKNPKVYYCGDIMYDNSLYFKSVANNKSTIINSLQLVPNKFVLVTVHRNYNTDSVEKLYSIFSSLLEIEKKYELSIVIPLHPRTKSALKHSEINDLLESIKNSKNIKFIPPVSYLDMIALESNSRLILTDSGGVQKESFFFKKPCVVLRTETEWTELIENGNNVLSDADPDSILQAFNLLYNKKDFTYPPIFGDGNAAEFICNEIATHIN